MDRHLGHHPRPDRRPHHRRSPPPRPRELIPAALDLGFNNGNGRKDELNENRGAVGWGEAYVLQSYLLMWEAYRDLYYLDKTIDHADHMLATRDSVRGVTDWRGLSLPAWRIYWPYSAGGLALADVLGRPSLRLRTAWTFAESLGVTVSAGTNPGTFKITTYHRDNHVGRTHDNLTMDPTSADFAVPGSTRPSTAGSIC
ncbi:hypothetical protein ACIBG5_08600 [Kribbella sp. NPDC050241]|uniref:hypothetical protein n=1 Tax=Kribbella sp. NPDC050241 TaxID=3364115 RepID=UPI0037AB6BA8